jgi:hypothetical protein
VVAARPGVLNDTIDRGWLFGWLLLLVSLIPVRLIGTWNQGAALVAAGVWLRRRLLRGASLVDRQSPAKGSDNFQSRRRSSGHRCPCAHGRHVAAFAPVGDCVLCYWRGQLLAAPLLLVWPPASATLVGDTTRRAV